jgi:UDP-glucose 4-epimerase
MAILITGGAGYIGSVTVDLLRRSGEDVVVLDDLFRGHREALDPEIPFYEGKIGDAGLVEGIVRRHSVDECIHFAALAYVGESVLQPALYYENNVEQSVRLLHCLAEMGIARVVFSSTCAIYGVPRQLPIPEEHPQLPVNPYGWSKFLIERVLEKYGRSYDLRFAALRYFNAAGATEIHGEHHEPETHLLPNVLAVAQGRLPFVRIFGATYPTRDGTAVRDYIHVADLASAHRCALDYLRSGGASAAFNLGNERGYSILELVETARIVTGRSIEYKFEQPRPGDPPELVGAAANARRSLGWQPVYTDLATIIRTAWQWHCRNPHGYLAPPVSERPHTVLKGR